MRNLLLSCQLLHLIQENVHLELGAQVLETAVAERLPVARMEKKQKKKQTVFLSEVISERQSTADVEWRQMKTHTGPLMIKDIITFMSAMYSFRSGYGRSTSALL